MSPIKILIDRDSVEVWSPGGFAAPLTSSQFRSGITHARNPLIARVFRDLRLAERLGSGLSTILDTYQAAGLEPPQILEGPNYVKVILSRHAAKAGSTSASEERLRVIESVGKVSIEELSQRLALSTTTVRRRLLPLVNDGRVVREGLGRATMYRSRGPAS